MIRSDLRNNGFNERTIEPKHSGINRLWLILTLLLLFVSSSIIAFFMVNFMGLSSPDEPDDIFMTIAGTIIGGLFGFLGPLSIITGFLLFLIGSLLFYLV